MSTRATNPYRREGTAFIKGLLVTLCALLAMRNASACSCDGKEAAGFIHANLERLPANARGALFQLPPPAGATLDPASFTIVSDHQKSPLKVLITWPVLGIEQPGQLSEHRLARVGPAGGFRPGARYTISYNGKVDSWRFPARTSFTIDTAALEVGTYRLAAAGIPARQQKWREELQYAVGPVLGPVVRAADIVRSRLLDIIDNLADAVAPAAPLSATKK